MKAFLKLMLVFAVVQAGVLFVVFLMSLPPDNYRAAAIDKQRLLRETPSPRIVLVGGSSLAFGIDSPTIERELQPGCRVINMGLHAGLGLDFILNEAADGVRQGDVVLLSPGYDVIWFDTVQYVDMGELIRFVPRAAGYVAPHDRWPLIRSMVLEQPVVALHDIAVTSLHNVFPGLAAHGVYYRSSFNSHGDNVAARDLDRSFDPDREMPPVRVESAAYRRNLRVLKEFAEEMRRRGACVFFAPSPLDERRYAENSDLVHRTLEDIDDVAGVKVIGSAADEVFSAESFYDTSEHLRGRAVFDHSRRLAAALSAVDATSGAHAECRCPSSRTAPR